MSYMGGLFNYLIQTLSFLLQKNKGITIQQPQKKKIIIDCDPGVDDIEAIIMALAAQHVEVIAITAVAGNTFTNQTFINIQKILYHCNRTDIPVYKDPKVNLMGHEPTSDGYFGADGLCDLDLEYDKTIPYQQLISPQALLYYTHKYPGEVNLVAIGPLTNLAIAYLIDSSFPKRLASLYVMGGDRSETTVNNVTPYAEFNCYCDPPAWQLVMNNFKLDGDKKIIIIDYKFCGDHILPLSFLNSYFMNTYADDNQNKKALLIRKTHEYMSKKFTSFGDVTCDPFALFVCMYPQHLITGSVCELDKIHMDGQIRGHTEFRYDDAGHLLLVDQINFDIFLKIMLDSLKL